MIQQRNNVLWHKLNGGLRLALVKGLANSWTDNIIVNEYPKSGGSWPAQMIAEATNLPFPNNRLPTWRSSILHGHYNAKVNIPKRMVVWRDGRDVMVSWYYHLVVGHEYTNPAAMHTVRKQAGITDPENLEESFPLALIYFLKGPRYPRFTWASFVDKWADEPNAVNVKYEDLKTDAQGELKRIVHELTGEVLEDLRTKEIVDKFSFKKQTGRAPGAENKKKYMRKGIVGDWKNHFSPASRAMFDEFAGKQLIKLGYETDNSWVQAE